LVDNSDDELKRLIESAEGEEFYDILKDLVNIDKNLSLKTEINRPRNLAILKIISEYSQSLNLERTNKLLESFIEIFQRYMVSYKRGSRTEIIEALKSKAKSDSEKTIEDVLEGK